MHLAPGTYYRELATTACMVFWMTFAMMGVALSTYRGLRADHTPPPKDKAEVDEPDKGRRGH
jgi:hypothetical protein